MYERFLNVWHRCYIWHIASVSSRPIKISKGVPPRSSRPQAIKNKIDTIPAAQLTTVCKYRDAHRPKVAYQSKDTSKVENSSLHADSPEEYIVNFSDEEVWLIL